MPNWHYHNATYGDDPRVGNFMRNVQAQRAELDNTPDEWVRLPFSWPSDSFDNYTSPVPLVATPLPPAGAELWPDDSTHATGHLKPYDKYKEGEAQWRYLTPQRVSSYHSHLSVVRRIVDDNVRLGVDFNWDILYLGFCWSSETHFPAIVGEYSRPTKNQLHPAHIPRCLHAYALSPAGAIKVLKHIRHVQFAYGRSNDEAYEWLIWQKRVEGFTTVPPLIIQRKAGHLRDPGLELVPQSEILKRGLNIPSNGALAGVVGGLSSSFGHLGPFVMRAITLVMYEGPLSRPKAYQPGAEELCYPLAMGDRHAYLGRSQPNDHI
ncbi:hypothetical protein DL96DRAFT_1753143 [Flagelloscypha sp. PMI_526]|nr:hypothetical protein DL96DRAFT_1753143 [Flagelloscypha sp. PMI_526]